MTRGCPLYAGVRNSRACVIEQAAQCGNCCRSAEFSSTAFGVTKYGNASGMERMSNICDCKKKYMNLSDPTSKLHEGRNEQRNKEHLHFSIRHLHLDYIRREKMRMDAKTYLNKE